ncbi:hypothetical protein CEXT_351541, partial [Caerostris extrusa]
MRSDTKIYSRSSSLEEKKAHSITVFGIERRERAQMLSEETELFSERGSSETEIC